MLTTIMRIQSFVFAVYGVTFFLVSRDWPFDVLGDGDRLLVVGGRSKVPSSPNLPIKSWALAWASQDDGATWYEVTSLQKSTEGIFGMPNDQRPAGFRAVTAFGDGFVAVGGTGDGSAPVWTGTWNQKRAVS